MTDRCDRCGRIFLAEKDSEIMRSFKGKPPTILCYHCRAKWSELWIKTYGKEWITVVKGTKTASIETNGLWETFMIEKEKEIVMFD